MSDAGEPMGSRILVVRLGAMGDIIHTLPAVVSLKHAHQNSHLTWVVESRWAPLLEGNPFVDRVVLLRRDGILRLAASWRALRSSGYDFAVDFQGLMKSALTACAARPQQLLGFENTRERPAAIFYTTRVRGTAAHIVDRNLELAAAAGALEPLPIFPIPAGRPEGDLPEGDFVLASPFAGWRSKQWPVEHYAALASFLKRECGIPLVLNGPPGPALDGAHPAVPHRSGLAGLIDATRRAAAVVGVDSGPLHLAAALGKPGVAIFGPTDPARNGPYGGSLTVLRRGEAETTYKRNGSIDENMRRITPDEVFEHLRTMLHQRRAGSVVR